MRYVTRHVLIVATLMMLGLSAVADAAPFFTTPIAGVPYQDWTIVNYVDRDRRGGHWKDYRDATGNNAYTYDGHDGIDFTLANFAVMDNGVPSVPVLGVPVFAADAGTVTDIQDGFYDRCAATAGRPCPGGNANYVKIDHGGGFETWYWHLRQDSVRVAKGQHVGRGDIIGLVGSSGNSTDAHLHFGVFEDGNAIETYEDPNTFWLNPLPYAGDVSGVLDHGLTDHDPYPLELRERPAEFRSFRPGQNVHQWVNLFGAQVGDTVTFRWFDPWGDEFTEFDFPVNELIRYDFPSGAITLPDSEDFVGTWQVAFELNGTELARDSFLVTTPEPSSILIWISIGVATVGIGLWTRGRGSVNIKRATAEKHTLLRPVPWL